VINSILTEAFKIQFLWHWVKYGPGWPGQSTIDL